MSVDLVSGGEVTRLLWAVQQGNVGALDRLFALVYNELRQLARRQLAWRSAGSTLQPTALVHDVYLKLAEQGEIEWKSRAHFFGIASHAMRQILVNLFHARNSQKRGGGWYRTTLGEGPIQVENDLEDLIALDQAISRLSERQQRVVEYRFFGGMDEQEIAEVLGVSTRTVEREWVRARAWLYRYLHSERH